MDATGELDATFHLLLSLSNESDRGCVILVAAYLDDLLQKLHETKMQGAFPSKKVVKDLFEGQGPLASSSAKSKLAFAYGLISKEDFDDLNLLRRLRNDAAHINAAFDFGRPELRKRLYSISAPKRISLAGHLKLSPEEKRMLESPNGNPETAKLYLLQCGMSLGLLIVLYT